ncbi:high frequency lysogenization protein HflD [Cellvibrio zantedeschiae]|uniref:High frequency lysogenization protein HflD homolog n=1 Tax=Cellvibrio zantedeschiae TaxID=1237077 RepID=A0ABQ3AUG8_9GAMM|nr:high frequency lysogenization protein HflD [Cellvibrio zantedeschiae]GGY66751.1 high frequency lysogenization protein HflD [Cellvibrio zantedeschiae]
MSKNLQEITLALAGVVQAAILVEQVAKTGQTQPDAYKCSIESLFDLNPASTLAVYGGSAQHLRIGLEALRDMLAGKHKHQEAMRYALGALHLQKKLAGRRDMLNTIASRISQAAGQAEHFSSTHDNVIGNLGQIYSETISTFRFRIQVMGDYNYLQQTRIASQIRALLLAAIRSAILWRQLGGTRWQLLLQRKAMAAEVDKLLRNLPY